MPKSYKAVSVSFKKFEKTYLKFISFFLSVSAPPPIYSSLIPQPYGHWPGDPNLSGFHMSESDYRPSDQLTMSSAPPDVLPTLPAQELQGSKKAAKYVQMGMMFN